MDDVVVEANGLSKKFRKGEMFDSLRDLIPALARRAMSTSSNFSAQDSRSRAALAGAVGLGAP